MVCWVNLHIQNFFTNVRENAGIAYTVSSQLDLFSGLLGCMRVLIEKIEIRLEK